MWIFFFGHFILQLTKISEKGFSTAEAAVNAGCGNTLFALKNMTSDVKI